MSTGKLYSAEEAREPLEGTTPGPWVRWMGHTSIHAGDITRNDPGTIAGAQEVCEVNTHRHNKYDPDPMEDDCECGCEEEGCDECYPTAHADARLITAAPDLAATVIALHEQLETLRAAAREERDAESARDDLPPDAACDALVAATSRVVRARVALIALVPGVTP